jgi:hypothetical protein
MRTKSENNPNFTFCVHADRTPSEIILAKTRLYGALLGFEQSPSGVVSRGSHFFSIPG